MTTTKTKPQFARLTEEQLTYMERVQIDSKFVTPEQVSEIEATFGLHCKTVDELRAVRNTVVKYFGTLASIARMCESPKSYDRAMAAMSGITAVIDHHIYESKVRW